MRPFGHALLVVAPLLVRLGVACDSYDRAGDPRFHPFAVAASAVKSCEHRAEGTFAIGVTLSAQIHQATYHCSEDTGVLSCGSPSQNPNDECSSGGPDFGPHWGDEIIDRDAPIVTATVVGCQSTPNRPCGNFNLASSLLLDRIDGSGNCPILDVTVRLPNGTAAHTTTSFCWPPSCHVPPLDAGVSLDAAADG